MTDPNTDCPSRWSSLTEGSKRSCGRVVFGQYICYSVFFSVSGGPYNQVCGRIKAYQKGLPSAYNLNGKTSVDDAYILQWCACIAWQSSTAHLDLCCRREGNVSGLNYCPCDTSPYTLHIPSFVGKENFCESGIVYPGVRDFNYCSLLTDDILWDGKDVTQLAPAALSTILHTSLKYLEQPT